MTAGPLATLLDYCGNRVMTGISGVHAVYSAHASDNPDRVLWIPDSLDADVTCLVWPAGGDVVAGNSETLSMGVDLHFWFNKANVGQALMLGVQAVDACLVLFRKDITAGGNVAWVLMRGYQPPTDEAINGVTYLVQTVNLRSLAMHFSHDYTVDLS